ncbi:MAG: isoaspartyl peptidase/L-asparaginase [Terricaulis silvestris]
MFRSFAAPILALVLVALMGSAARADNAWTSGPGYQTEVVGNEAAPTTGTVRGGFLLSGGGDWNTAAFRWFVAHAGHGHIVVLSASDSTDAHNEFYRTIGGVASVRLFLFRGRQAAYDRRLLEAVRHADGIFLGGGDQANYIRMWRGTPLNRAIDAAVAAGKPIGGTSAGLAVQGAWLYGAMDGDSITAEHAMHDPLGPGVTIEGNFLHTPQLAHILTDSHFDTRERLGRLIAFVAKAHTLAPQTQIAGLGIDESSAMTVETDGTAHFYADRADKHAWLVTGGDVRATTGHPLNARGVRVVGIGPNTRFNAITQDVENPAFSRTYDVRDGVLTQNVSWSLAIHGGAGVIDRGDLTPERDRAYRAALTQALDAGRAVLEHGGTALDAVQASIVIMEDSPLFNAGKGAAIAADDNIYLDAAIMDGADQRAGAVAALTTTKNPILAARAVMEHSRHVFLAGAGADSFARAQSLEQVDPSYFRTPEREQMLREWRRDHHAQLDPTHMYGTVGAVALDENGHLAAATSTGGLTGKEWGRIGDSPLIGAGTYARDGDCAVSATGTGEFFIRDSAARQVCDRVRWNHEDIENAAHNTIMSVGGIGGDGGLIAMDADGKPSFAINDLGMYRGAVSSADPHAKTAIYGDETLR